MYYLTLLQVTDECITYYVTLLQVTDECTIRTNSPKFPHDADFGCGQCSSRLEAAQSKLTQLKCSVTRFISKIWELNEK